MISNPGSEARAEEWSDLGWYERLLALGWDDSRIAEWTTDLLDLLEQGETAKLREYAERVEEQFMLQAPDLQEDDDR